MMSAKSLDICVEGVALPPPKNSSQKSILPRKIEKCNVTQTSQLETNVEKELKNNSNKIETWKEREKSLRMDIDCALIY